MFLNQLEFKTYQDLSQKEDEFLEVLRSAVLEEEVYRELSLFFKNLTQEEARKYQHTYWRWFVYLGFRRFSAVPKEDVLEFFDRQLIMACVVGFEIWREFINYFVLNFFDENSAKGFYVKLRNKITTSDFVVGEDKGKILTLSAVVEKIKRMHKQNISSLEQAELLSSLKKLLFPKDQIPSYIVPAPDEVVGQVISMVNFLEAVEPEDFWEMLQFYIEQDFYNVKITELDNGLSKPQRSGIDVVKPKFAPVAEVEYQQDFHKNAEILKKAEAERKEAARAAQPLSVTAVKEKPPVTVAQLPEIKSSPAPQIKKVDTVKPVEIKKIEPKAEEIKPVSKPITKTEAAKPPEPKDDPMFFKKNPPQPTEKTVDTISAPQALQKPPQPKKEEEKKQPEVKKPKLSYGEIRKQIESRFPKDPNGEFVNVVDVMNELTRLSGEYGDEKIRDLYYFNEQSGQFEWHEPK